MYEKVSLCLTRRNRKTCHEVRSGNNVCDFETPNLLKARFKEGCILCSPECR